MRTVQFGMACLSALLLTQLVACTKEFSPEFSSQLGKQLQSIIDANIKGGNEKNLDLAMSCFHSKSASYITARDGTKRIFQDYNVKTRLLFMQVIGADQEYVVARVKYETKQDTGPAFRNNISDTMQVFRKERDQWKLWTSALLDIKYLQ
jgi:hypothetical protein